MKKLFMLLSLIGALLLLGTSLPAAAQTPAGPPRAWQANPPIHARPFASTSPSGTYTTTVTNVTASGLTWDGLTPSNSFTK